MPKDSPDECGQERKHFGTPVAEQPAALNPFDEDAWYARAAAPEQVSKLNITDGDCLVIKCPHVVSRDEAFHLKSAFTALVDNLGVNAKVIILDRGMDIAVLTKGEPERAPAV